MEDEDEEDERFDESDVEGDGEDEGILETQRATVSVHGDVCTNSCLGFLHFFIM